MHNYVSMRFSATLAIILFTFGWAPTMAQEIKIGVVQSDFVVSKLPEANAARKDIAAFEKKLNNKLLAMRQGLQQQFAVYQAESESLSDSARAEREQELQALQQDIAQEQQTANQQLQFKILQVMSPLEQKVQRVVDSVAQANSYTHVFPNSLNNQSMFVYVQNPKEVNMTPIVLKALGITIDASGNALHRMESLRPRSDSDKQK